LKSRINQFNFHETFKAHKKIGKGNFASVYLVEEIGTGEKSAVKAFCKESAYD
jgi:serine/threonine protein kinase